MADENGNAGAAAATNPQLAPKVAIQAQYVRDSSFENVAVTSGDGRLDKKPEIKVGVNLDAQKKGDDLFEVVLKVNATATGDSATMFIAELEYAGIFKVENVPDNQLHPFLLIECPRILFPFSRRIIADMTRDGGYPPLMLDMVDFAGLYRNEVEKRRASAAAKEESAGNA